jgi:hypothetical protein
MVIMPDLTIEYHWMCVSNLHDATRVKGSKGDEYLVEFNGRLQQWHCDCQGFKFRHTCKHVKEAEKNRCGWNAFTDDGDVVEVPVDDDHPNGYACPECGGEITSQAWGV